MDQYVKPTLAYEECDVVVIFGGPVCHVESHEEKIANRFTILVLHGYLLRDAQNLNESCLLDLLGRPEESLDHVL